MTILVRPMLALMGATSLAPGLRPEGTRRAPAEPSELRTACMWLIPALLLAGLALALATDALTDVGRIVAR